MKKTITLISCLLIGTALYAQSEPSPEYAWPHELVSPQPAEALPRAEQQTDKSLLEQVEDWYSDNMNYWSIAALMAVESSFIPFPSEVVIPPAAYVASREDSTLHVSDSYAVNLLLIIVAGTVGALIGAIINYVLSLLLGRPIIYAFANSKIGHLCLLSAEKLERAEQYFNEHGRMSTFVGRLIPAIRQLISIPAGLSKMHFGVFLAYTALGATAWNSVLALLGYIANGQMDLIHKYSQELSYAILGAVGLVVIYFVVKYLRGRVKGK